MDLLESIKATYAVMGQEIPDLGLELLALDLQHYPLEHVQLALARCRRELKRLTVADILQRLPGQHPGPEEAWAMLVRGLVDEDVTIVWTEEMRKAFAVCHALKDDTIAARLAFKESYVALVAEAQLQHRAPSWSVSLGLDKRGREAVLTQAVEDGKIAVSYAVKCLPESDDPAIRERLLALCPRLLT